MTAPTSSHENVAGPNRAHICPFVSAKGDFPDTPDSIMARAQRLYGENATFGLKVAKPVGPSTNVRACRLGKVLERGYFDYRWPFNRYELEKSGERVGTCTLFSCFQAGTLWQVMRLEAAGKATLQVPVVAGGRVRFDCMCSALDPGQYSPTLSENQKELTLRASGLLGWTFTMELIDNEERIRLNQDTAPAIQAPSDSYQALALGGTGTSSKDYGSIFSHHTFTVEPGKPRDIIASFTFKYSGSSAFVGAPPHDITNLAGIGEDTARSKLQLWHELYPSLNPTAEHHGEAVLHEARLVGRCLEKILNVNFMPVSPNQDHLGHDQFYLPVVALLPKAHFNFQDILYASYPDDPNCVMMALIRTLRAAGKSVSSSSVTRCYPSWPTWSRKPRQQPIAALAHTLPPRRLRTPSVTGRSRTS